MWGLLVAGAVAASPCADTLAGAVDGALPAHGAVVVVVHKGARKVALYKDERRVDVAGLACLPVALAPGAPAGPKVQQGDRRTPEGWYRTSDKPWSSFAHAIAVHYPNAEDARRALADGRIDAATAASITAAVAQDRKPPQGTALGGEILLHGGGSGADWTLGCVALDDAHIVALRALLPADMRFDVAILP